MRVTLEGPLGVTVLGLVAGEVPDDQGVVAATRQEHVGAEGGQASANRVQVWRVTTSQRPTAGSPKRGPFFRAKEKKVH